jgi:VWFA-related protein
VRNRDGKGRIDPDMNGLLVFALLAYQSGVQQPPPAAPTDNKIAEVTTQDAPATFTSRSNLVLVHVVVRDRAGQTSGTLRKEDFLLLDRGKPQIISKFAVEKSGKPTKAADPSAEDKPGTPPPIAPEHFVAYLFDDAHLSFGDLAMARNAAEKHLSESLQSDARAAIFTTSGQTTLDFTDDLAKLRDALMRIQPRSRSNPVGIECPDLNYYMADLIQNKNDPIALQDAVAETMVCARLDPTMASVAPTLVQAAASRVLGVGDMETRQALGVLKDVVRRTASMPGQRTVVLVSPGFLMLADQRADEMDLVDRAIRSNVTISTLDARGLYTVVPGGDASQGQFGVNVARLKPQNQTASANAEGDVLAELADSTGGIFFHNNNDLSTGFKRVGSAPEYYYVLGFSPQNLKFDGSYHALKVGLALKNSSLTLQARRGYVAPKHELDAAQEAKREIEEMLFSRDELRDIPVTLNTQFFKSSAADAKLTVLARVDLKQLRFRKVDGRNFNILTVVSGIFDRNGIYVTGLIKTVEMHLKEETLAVRLASPITIRSSLDLTPGSYFVRLVVRDTEGATMAAVNGAVVIP